MTLHIAHGLNARGAATSCAAAARVPSVDGVTADAMIAARGLPGGAATTEGEP